MSDPGSRSGVLDSLGLLRVSRLRFHATATDPIEWGGFPGSAVRGGFLAGLLDVGCVVDSRDCPRCDLRDACPVTRISGEDEPPSPTRTALYRIVPPESGQRIEPGESFTFGVDLYGDAAEARSVAVAAALRFAERGVGRRRARFEIDSVPERTGPLETRLRDSLIEATSRLEAIAEKGLRIRLESPLRIVAGGRALSSFSFDPFVRSLVRRARLLLESAEGATLEVDLRELLASTAGVRVLDAHLSKRDQVRFSSRQGRSMNLHGVEGDVVVAGDLTAFCPWLAFGMVVGAGKGATFGHGAFRCEPVDSPPPGVARR